MCYINVRTIQRIEAGEVPPRSYTLKNILEALGVNIVELRCSHVFFAVHLHMMPERWVII